MIKLSYLSYNDSLYTEIWENMFHFNFYSSVHKVAPSTLKRRLTGFRNYKLSPKLTDCHHLFLTLKHFEKSAVARLAVLLSCSNIFSIFTINIAIDAVKTPRLDTRKVQLPSRYAKLVQRGPSSIPAAEALV